MNKIITYDLAQDMIGNIAQFILDKYTSGSNDFSKIACVFPIARPAVFLKKALEQKINGNYFPPKIFTMDEFVEDILFKDNKFKKISGIEANHIIYRLIKKIDPGILKGRNFLEFMFWAGEIYSFINQLDIENVGMDALSGVEMSASIGYEIPSEINEILKNIGAIRAEFHKVMDKRKSYSRGYVYQLASGIINKEDLSEYKEILFCGFFYLQKTENAIIKAIYDKGRAYLIFQGNTKIFGGNISPIKNQGKTANIELYAGRDSHSQAAICGEIIKKINTQEKTVIVLPDPNMLPVLLPYLKSGGHEFNLSLKYSLKRSSLYSLIAAIFKTQLSIRSKLYYTPDYLEVINHPLIKNIKYCEDQEDVMNTLFIGLDEISYGNKDIEKIHAIAFKEWENISTLKEFASVLGDFIKIIVSGNDFKHFPVDIAIADKLLQIIDELKQYDFANDKYGKEEIFRNFEKMIDDKSIFFAGMPNRGIHILGLFDTHCLSFDNVIMLDANESKIPNVSLISPLIPRDIMLSLGLNRISSELEIQRYQFMRLMACAKNAHLIYIDDGEMSRSRFIEEYIWAKEKALSCLNVVPVKKAEFKSGLMPKKNEVKKNTQCIEKLKNMVYSATAVNTYLNCPSMFYYRYFLGLKEADVMLDDLDSRDVGNFIHKLFEDIFRPYIGEKPLIDIKFRKDFFKKAEIEFNQTLSKKMKADSFLLHELLFVIFDRFVTNEKNRPIIKIMGLEQKYERSITADSHDFKFTAKIDRIDLTRDKELLIIDYKTGSRNLMPSKKIETFDLADFDRKKAKKIYKSFQLPIYLYILQEQFSEYNLNAAFYNIKKVELKQLWEKEDPAKRDKLLDIYMIALRNLLKEIIDPGVPFVADEDDESICKSCQYCLMCR